MATRVTRYNRRSASGSTAIPAASEPAAVQADPVDEDLFASPPGLWLPRTVVKEHRRKATVIWIVLLLGFSAYVAYIVWETVQSRKDPASSIEFKQEYYKFPDVMLCPNYLQGCQTTSKCAQQPSIISLNGFLDNSTTFMDDHAADVQEIEDVYNLCEVIPLSRATPNVTGIENKDIVSFSIFFFMLWDEELEDEFDSSSFNNQAVTMYFIDIDDDIDDIGGEIVDAKLPYARVNLTMGETFTSILNHVVMDLTEFTGINSNGRKQEKQRSYSQSTTTAPQNWFWDADGDGLEYALMMVEMSIGKFEFTSIEEVDPVDAWSILGAIGGIWQFVVTGFGLFFVFSVKQAPDLKIRNFKKTIAKPAVIVNRRLSSISGRSSDADIEIDASEEDLPQSWVKKQRPNGSVYYFNVLTGVSLARSPNDLGGTDGGNPAPARGSTASRVFQNYPEMTPAHNPSSQASGSTALGSSHRQPPAADGSPLPPGWMSRIDEKTGKLYYQDTISKKTQWERPAQRVHSAEGRDGRPRVVDTPMTHTRRGSNASSSAHSHSSVGAPVSRRNSAAALSAAASSPPDADAPAPPVGSTAKTPSYRTALLLSNSGKQEKRPAPAETAAGRKLPPHWHMRTTAENKPYYLNSQTKQTQWEAPHS
eukprot:g2457.t1